MKVRYLWFVLLGGLTIPLLAADSLPVHPFRALYNGTALVKLSPTTIELSLKGNMEMSLTDAGNGRYQMSTTITSLVGTVDSQASGEFQGNMIHPLHYQQQVSSIKQSMSQLIFNWQTKTLDVLENEKQKTLTLTEGVVDPLSLYLLVMRDLQEGRTPGRYTLVNHFQLRTYQAMVEGEEILDTPLGKLHTLRISSKRDTPDSERDTIFWFAPELSYLPVQVIRQDEGKETLRMSIAEVKSNIAK